MFRSRTTAEIRQRKVTTAEVPSSCAPAKPVSFARDKDRLGQSTASRFAKDVLGTLILMVETQSLHARVTLLRIARLVELRIGQADSADSRAERRGKFRL